jgi:hypothetical protein
MRENIHFLKVKRINEELNIFSLDHPRCDENVFLYK